MQLLSFPPRPRGPFGVVVVVQRPGQASRARQMRIPHFNPGAILHWTAFENNNSFVSPPLSLYSAMPDERIPGWLKKRTAECPLLKTRDHKPPPGGQGRPGIRSKTKLEIITPPRRHSSNGPR